jgi:NAD(P)H-flavin reductase
MARKSESTLTASGRDGVMIPRPFRIGRRRRDTYDTFTLELASENGTGSDQFAPGQFNMLYVFGVGEVPISISGDPSRPDTFVHTTRAVGTVTKSMSRLRTGDLIGVRGPFGTHWPVEQARGRDVIIVAGGIGLAPLRPAIYHFLSHREEYGKLVLLYGTRSPADLLYRRELERWRSRLDLEVQITVDRAAPGWRGNVGVVTTLIQKAPVDHAKAVAFVCGPEVMMRFTALELQKRGLPGSNILVSMERNMKCGVGLCGHCQYGPLFVCKDGPVFPYHRVRDLLAKREI